MGGPKAHSIAVLLVILGAGCVSTPHPSSRPVSGAMAQAISGPLRTSGRSVVDRSGHPVSLRCIGIPGMEHGQGTPDSAPPGQEPNGYRAPPSSAFTNVAEWGFNCVRLAVSWANIEPAEPLGAGYDGPFNEAYGRAVDRVVSGFTTRGVAVILASMQHGWGHAATYGPGLRGYGMPTWIAGGAPAPLATSAFFSDEEGVQQEYAAAMGWLAARYAPNPLVIGFDMFNEPASTWVRAGELNHLYDVTGRAVRAGAPGMLLVFEDATNGAGTTSLVGPPLLPNTIYSFHVYAPDWDHVGLPRAAMYVSRSKAWGIPLWIGEFNAFGEARARPQTPEWQQQLERMLAYCDQNEIGWDFWAYDDGNSLFQGSGGNLKPGLLPTLQRWFTPASLLPSVAGDRVRAQGPRERCSMRCSMQESVVQSGSSVTR